jgi:hypothetical protein
MCTLELDGPAVSALRRAVAAIKTFATFVGLWMGDQKFIISSSSVLRKARWSQLNSQSPAPTNPHWARVVDYGLFSLCVICKEGLCPSSGDINRLMMMIAVHTFSL